MNLPAKQEAIRAKCFHPSGNFIEFPKEDVETSIPERFEKIVRMYPDRVAVKTTTKIITYEQLNRSANALAHHLLKQCHRGQEPVGIYVNDGVNLIIAHLGVVKAGKFSFHLDPFADQARINHLINDSRTKIVITDSETEARARSSIDCKQLILLSLDKTMTSASEENVNLPISSEDFVYLRYTSVSTGNAKGGMKSHHHVLHAAMNATNCFHICPDDSSLLFSGDFCFGKYAFEILLNGATLSTFFVKEEGLEHLAHWLIDSHISLFVSFPSTFRTFVNILPERMSFFHLRLIRLEGEPVYRSDVELYKNRFASECVLVNSYSSTETGPVCVYFLDKDGELVESSVPAGYPIYGKQILILDESRKILGPNKMGQVAVKSAVLSSGYWRQSQLTDNKFVFGSQAEQERIYFTGDLGSLTDTGCLHLGGRKDFQVKVRGYRVDVGEVEAVLALHPEVKEATVVGKADDTGDMRLVAYYVLSHDCVLTASDLRNFLLKRLPEYMIPSMFVVLEKLPLLSTGKVNRKALPEPARTRPEQRAHYAKARNDGENTLVKIWEEVLDVHPIGIYDNFFDLGGDSLAATRVVSRVIKQFQLEIPLQSLFQSPTVAAMAAVVTEHQGKALDKQGLAVMLDELELLSEEDAEQLLGKRHHDISKE